MYLRMALNYDIMGTRNYKQTGLFLYHAETPPSACSRVFSLFSAYFNLHLEDPPPPPHTHTITVDIIMSKTFLFTNFGVMSELAQIC